MNVIKKLIRYLKYWKEFNGEWCAAIVPNLPPLSVKGRYSYNLIHINEGTYSNVSFDYVDIYEREDKYHDIMGFFHTHPPGFSASPSQTDINTMKAWAKCLGKALYCIIDCGWEIKVYDFLPDGEAFIPVWYGETKRIDHRYLTMEMK